MWSLLCQSQPICRMIWWKGFTWQWYECWSEYQLDEYGCGLLPWHDQHNSVLFLIFFFGTCTWSRSMTHVNGALATFWGPVLSIGWIIARPQLKFISLGLLNRLSNYYDYDDENGQQNQYTTNSHGHHCTVTHIWTLVWQRFALFLF